MAWIYLIFKFGCNYFFLISTTLDIYFYTDEESNYMHGEELVFLATS
jgi:hypothetical protein